VSRCHTFDRFRTLVGPIQVADEKHGSPPSSEFTNTPWQQRHASFECVHGEDNTIPHLVHAERPAASEARILEMAQALNIISPEALEPVIKSRDSKVEFSVRCELAALNSGHHEQSR
jgi:hypothetical protein